MNAREEIELVDTTSSCASCGVAEVDDIKLNKCDDCDLVEYCSNECQRDHKSQHEDACTMRAAELRRDDLLFKQPASTHLGDCPICCLPLPYKLEDSTLMLCCFKVICDGCAVANVRRLKEGNLQPNCLFCREPVSLTTTKLMKYHMKRVNANDPHALRLHGQEHSDKGDDRKAFEFYTKAAQLGDVEAHLMLSFLYHKGEGVEEDSRKARYHLEEAAIGGHPSARYNLGLEEWRSGNIEKAVKHWIIAATQGEDSAIKALMEMFKRGFVSKEDLAAAFRAHKAAVDATKSPQREEAEEYYRRRSSQS